MKEEPTGLHSSNYLETAHARQKHAKTETLALNAEQKETGTDSQTLDHFTQWPKAILKVFPTNGDGQTE